MRDAYNDMSEMMRSFGAAPSLYDYIPLSKQPRLLLLLLVRQSPFSQLITTRGSLFPYSLDLVVIGP